MKVQGVEETITEITLDELENHAAQFIKHRRRTSDRLIALLGPQMPKVRENLYQFVRLSARRNKKSVVCGKILLPIAWGHSRVGSAPLPDKAVALLGLG